MEPIEINHYQVKKKNNQLLLRKNGFEDEIPFRIVFARPLSSENFSELSLVSTEDGQEILFLEDLEELDEKSAFLLKKEIQKKHFLPIIQRVLKTEARHGNRYWKVETDSGLKSFVIRHPENAVTWLSSKRLLLRDSHGHHYLIEDYLNLDERSKMEMDRVI